MNAEELVAKLEDKSASCLIMGAKYSIFSRGSEHMRGKREAYDYAASLIRQHLYTPNPLQDAAADMLAALEKYRDDLCEGTCNYLLGINEDCQGCLARVVVARAKGAPDAK